MKKTLAILALSSLALMAATPEAKTYIGTLSTQKCTSTCSYADYSPKDKLVAIIDGKSYDIKIKDLSDAKIEVALGRDDVTFKGIIEGSTIVATQVERVPTHEGFLGVQSCTQKGEFADCDLKNYADGDKVVAVVDGKTYLLNKQAVSQTKIDHAIMQNSVGFFGKIEGNTLVLEDMIYEGPKKNFFKGCM